MGGKTTKKLNEQFSKYLFVNDDGFILFEFLKWSLKCHVQKAGIPPAHRGSVRDAWSQWKEEANVRWPDRQEIIDLTLRTDMREIEVNDPRKFFKNNWTRQLKPEEAIDFHLGEVLPWKIACWMKAYPEASLIHEEYVFN